MTDNNTGVLNGKAGQAIRSDAAVVRNTPLSTDVFFEEYDESRVDDVWPFFEVVDSLMGLAHLTRSEVSNTVPAVSRFLKTQTRALEGRE